MKTNRNLLVWMAFDVIAVLVFGEIVHLVGVNFLNESHWPALVRFNLIVTLMLQAFLIIRRLNSRENSIADHETDTSSIN